MFNTLYIIESLKVGDEKTGKWLKDDLLAHTFINDKLEIEYVSIDSKIKFINFLEYILSQINSNLKFPAIHIEVHGDQNGIEIAQTQEYIKWSEINDIITKINISTRNNLILQIYKMPLLFNFRSAKSNHSN